MKKPTPAEAERFAQHLARKFGARIVRRSDSIEFQMVRAALQTITFGVVDLDDLLGRYSQALGPLVYISDAHAADPEHLLSVVVHELEHVCQWQRDMLGMPWLYVTEREARVAYEAKAYAAGAEFERGRTGVVPDLDALTWPLEGPAYMLSPEHIALGRRMLESRRESIKRGVVQSKVAREALRYLRAEMPHLLAS